MRVLCHGGFCCGVTHIMGFPSLLTSMVPERVKQDPSAFHRWKMQNPTYYWDIDYGRPKETAEERFRYLVDAVPTDAFTARPRGILEVILTTFKGGGTAEVWRPLLTELSFKEVNSHINSNSARTLHVFHKNTGV